MNIDDLVYSYLCYVHPCTSAITLYKLIHKMSNLQENNVTIMKEC